MTVTTITLDPWVASSLLQKAIRRGEADLALLAAHVFQRHRGKGVWRRLLNIAVEDVGTADPALVLEVIRLATNPQLRSVLGSDGDLIRTLVEKLAAAPKDRSVDYLYCAAIRHPDGLAATANLASRRAGELLTIAANLEEPMLRRAAATLLACTKGDAIRTGSIEPLFRVLGGTRKGEAIIAMCDAVRLAGPKASHPFFLMLPILASVLDQGGGPSGVVDCVVPEARHARGVPLYAFDKHTRVGKQAITEFAHVSPGLANALEQVPADRRRDVALMAAFYADGVPISRRFAWDQSAQLELLGFEADMASAGCPELACVPILECVRANLPGLDQTRLAIFTRSSRQIS